MHSHFRFYVQPVRYSRERSYQVRMGLEGDNTIEYVPVYRSALGALFQLPVSHRDMDSAKLEIQMLEEILNDFEPGEINLPAPRAGRS